MKMRVFKGAIIIAGKAKINVKLTCFRLRLRRGFIQSDLKTSFIHDRSQASTRVLEALMAIRALVWNENEHEKRNALDAWADHVSRLLTGAAAINVDPLSE